MKITLLLIIAFASALLAAKAVPKFSANALFREAFRAKNPLVSKGRRLHLAKHAQANAVAAPPAQFFTQTLDHYDVLNNATWQQRFFVNDTFFNPALGGPLFFQVGGEGAIGAGDVDDLFMARLAQQHGALQVVLEHRFYGESQPFASLKTENLKWLSSQYAIADAAVFIEAMLKNYTTVKQVVSFGGSYPGALSAWLRVKLPHLIDFSVANSAPVLAIEDMSSYLSVVDRSLEHIGGVACDTNVRAAFSQLDSLLATAKGRASLSQAFNTCTPLTTDWKDQANFLSDIIGNFMGTVQYNAELGDSPNITTLCDLMTEPNINNFDRLLNVTNLFTSGQCIDFSYANMIAGLNNLTAFGKSGVGDRQWTWQTCNEFGYFQSTDAPAKAQPFGTGVPVKFFRQICVDAFQSPYAPAIDFTNAYYGAAKPIGATRIVFTNGNLDPWSSLSVLKSLTPTLLSVVVDRAAHCAIMRPADMYKPSAMRSNIAAAQQKVAVIVNDWLSAGPL